MVQILVFVAQEGTSRKSLLDLFVMFYYSEINVKFRNLELFLSSDEKVVNVYTVLSLTNNQSQRVFLRIRDDRKNS